jgi:hypothetical protein
LGLGGLLAEDKVTNIIKITITLVILGYAFSDSRFIRLLVDGWSLPECSRVEDGPLLPYVVLMEGTQ